MLLNNDENVKDTPFLSLWQQDSRRMSRVFCGKRLTKTFWKVPAVVLSFFQARWKPAVFDSEPIRTFAKSSSFGVMETTSGVAGFDESRRAC
ncbi:hypothetical protein PC113_g12645 [Phytophthora cactorum]|uniref:Uncharacterized protein n=1 Tax=Phytophthora cactorum TaxID=29920 RepID=A0A8T0YZD6_9STRA|nr:hypothetical protein PC113_g12645 [Phytophthora cactorum]KAG2915288.1 hypothetical protein PC115_g11449 [Phytophthora cactorum]KAG3060424.1 hypothetical protein PC121_g13493 [Phytophthora cactorum]